jgi:hypothetical protein
MQTKLDVYDFDGTLFRSPCDTPENQKKYERATGIPWLIDKEKSRELSRQHGRHIGMRRGYWGRPETLEPPLVPDPAPKEWFNKEVCEAFLASKANPDALTLIVTGRHTGLKEQVLRILYDGKLVEMEMIEDKKGKLWPVMADENVGIYFLGMGDWHGHKPKTPKPSDTFSWKVWLMEQILEMRPEIKTIEMWEDRDEHVEKFKALDGVLAEKVIVNHVK